MSRLFLFIMSISYDSVHEAAKMNEYIYVPDTMKQKKRSFYLYRFHYKIMTLERITENNIIYAIQIQAELFPGESARTNYEDSLNNASGYEYYLIYDNGTCIGIVGLYTYPEDPDSAWLGWFGIREEFRRRHYGSKTLRIFEDMATSRGFQFARLYTDAENNDVAIAFYKANGYICELYQNMQDPACMKYKTLIFSKALTSRTLVPWENRTIHLTEQIAKQNRYG